MRSEGGEGGREVRADALKGRGPGLGLLQGSSSSKKPRSPSRPISSLFHSRNHAYKQINGEQAVLLHLSLSERLHEGSRASSSSAGWPAGRAAGAARAAWQQLQRAENWATSAASSSCATRCATRCPRPPEAAATELLLPQWGRGNVLFSRSCPSKLHSKYAP